MLAWSSIVLARGTRALRRWRARRLVDLDSEVQDIVERSCSLLADGMPEAAAQYPDLFRDEIWSRLLG